MARHFTDNDKVDVALWKEQGAEDARYHLMVRDNGKVHQSQGSDAGEVLRDIWESVKDTNAAQKVSNQKK